MKVSIGKYKNWIGPYQLADFLQKIGVSEDRCHEIGERLAETWLNDVCQWIDSKRKRTVKIKTHDYDHWNAYTTLAMIILPVMKDLREHKHGAGFIDDEDVPEEYRSTSAPPKENEWDSDANIFKRYDWVLDEVIWAFEHILDDEWEDNFHEGIIDFYFEPCNDGSGCSEMKEGPKHTRVTDWDGLKEVHDRIQRGTTLFGKYFQTFWD
jgi:hypothetical protein